MNKSRELFLLFPYVGQKVLGYTLIHKHTALNDEPPYKMCSFFNVSSDYYIHLKPTKKPVYRQNDCYDSLYSLVRRHRRHL